MKIDENENFFAKVKEKMEIHYEDGDVVFGDSVLHLQNKLLEVSYSVFIFVFCRKGRLQYEIDGKQYTVQQGEFSPIFPNMKLENLMSSVDTEVAILYMRPKMVQDFVMSHNLVNLFFNMREHPIQKLSEDEITNYNLIYSTFKSMIAREKRHIKQIISRLVEIFLFLLLDHYTIEEKDVAPYKVKGSSSEHLFVRFINMLNSMEVKPRLVTYYSEKLCITPKYLTCVCKQISGKSCSQWIHEATLRDIEFYLRQPDMNYKEIAFKLKFPNASFFSKYVREHLGCSPHEYRNRYKESLRD